MITCKPYKAKFKTDLTCITNQCKIKEILSKSRKPTHPGGAVLASKISEYYKICLCDGCKTGERLYAKAKKEGRLPSINHKNRRKIKATPMYQARTDMGVFA